MVLRFHGFYFMVFVGCEYLGVEVSFGYEEWHGDTMIRWFCILFQNQFSPDDVLDNYPVDRLMHDIALALMAVQAQTTDVLSDFPTTAATEPAQTPES